MNKLGWEDFLYSEKEFHEIYEHSDGFTDEVNTNHRTREEGESFEDFVDEGSDLLIKENLPLVQSLLRK